MKFLHSKHELEIYYFLLNKVELKNFKNNTLEVFCNDKVPTKTIDHIKKLLFTWVGEQCNVVIIQCADIAPLKTTLISQIKSENNWAIINEHFTGASIIDLVLE